MYDLFANSFVLDEQLSEKLPIAASIPSSHAGLSELFARFGGMSFHKGLYRVMSPSTVEQWEALIGDAFPHYGHRLNCFAYDWLGRVFAIDAGRREKEGCGVLLLEPGTGEALEIPCGIYSFHNDELVNHREEALAASFHTKWISAGGSIPTRKQCVGYKKPLFLGGKDTTANLEITDLDVYWTVFGALIRKTKCLPVGTQLGTIKLTE